MDFLSNNITEIIFAIIGAGLLIVFIKFNSRKEEDEPSVDLIRLPYEKGTILLTDTEQKFYHDLENFVGDQYKVFSKVRLSDIIKVKHGMDKADTKRFENMLNAISINYLLCTPQNTKPVIALELDDIVGDADEKLKRMAFIERVFKETGFPMLRFRVRGSYADEIKTQLEEHINFVEKTEESDTTA